MTSIRSLVAVVVMLFAGLTAGCSADTAAPVATSTAAADSTPVRAGTSGLPTVELVRLPAEAQQTHALILAGGPYPYSQDDAVFGNRERILPPQEYGWYREYTVRTPGSADRGARRFVVGEDGVFFYTDDHYDSFQEVLE